MASVQQPALEHPGPMSQRQSDTPDELDQELDWLIEKEEVCTIYSSVDKDSLEIY